MENNDNIVQSVDENESILPPAVTGSKTHMDIYNFLNHMSNSVGTTITEYHWREICELMKMMVVDNMVTVEFNKK